MPYLQYFDIPHFVPHFVPHKTKKGILFDK